MARITVEDCLQHENNRFALVLLASKRSKQLLTGSPILVTEVKNKAIVTSLREIAAGKVRFMTEDEQRAEESRKNAELEAARKAREEAAAQASAALQAGSAQTASGQGGSGDSNSGEGSPNNGSNDENGFVPA